MKRTSARIFTVLAAGLLLGACGGSDGSSEIFRTVKVVKTSTDCPAEANLDETLELELTITRDGDENFLVTALRIDGEPQSENIESTVEPLAKDEKVEYVDNVRTGETVALGSGFFGCFTCSHFGGSLTAKEGSSLDTDQGVESSIFVLDYYRGAVLGSCTARWVQQGSNP